MLSLCSIRNIWEGTFKNQPLNLPLQHYKCKCWGIHWFVHTCCNNMHIMDSEFMLKLIWCLGIKDIIIMNRSQYNICITLLNGGKTRAVYSGFYLFSTWCYWLLMFYSITVLMSFCCISSKNFKHLFHTIDSLAIWTYLSVGKNWNISDLIDKWSSLTHNWDCARGFWKQGMIRSVWKQELRRGQWLNIRRGTMVLAA